MIGRLIEFVRSAWRSRFESRSMHPRDPGLARIFGTGQEAASGVRVNEQTAMAVTTVFACVRVLAETFSTIPIRIYRRLPDGGRELAPDHPLQAVLTAAANPEMSGYTYHEVGMVHANLRGVHLAYKQYNNAGRVIELWPIRPDRAIPFRKDRRLYYMILVPPANTSGWGSDLDCWPLETHTPVTLPAELIYKVNGLTYDGVVGLSPVDHMREAIGLALATEQHGARYFGNSAVPGGLLRHPNTLSDEAARRIRESFERIHSGLSNSHKIAVLEENMEWQPTGLANSLSQFLETRVFQLEEICRWYRVPPHMVGHLKNSSYATAEQMSLEFATYTMAPWCRRWAQEIERQLFTAADRRQYLVDFDLDSIRLGDAKSRGEFYNQARNSGWMCVDEIRRREGLNPLPNGAGKIFLSPLNMVAAGGSGKPDSADPTTGAGGPVESVQDTALNGAQIASLLQVISAVAAGTLPRANAIEMILVSFPSVTREEADALVPEEGTEPKLASQEAINDQGAGGGTPAAPVDDAPASPASNEPGKPATQD